MIEQAQLNFGESSLMLLNVILAGMMFGVSLTLKIDDFKSIVRNPKAPVIGLLAQFAFMPAATCLATVVFKVDPQLALGMLLIAACPGGTFSNFMTWLGRGSLPVSVSMTAVSSTAALVMTPLNFSLYGYLNPYTRPLLTEIAIDPVQMLTLVAAVLVIPLLLGMWVGAKFPAFSEKSEKPMRFIGLMVLFVFVVVSIGRNLDQLKTYAHVVFVLVACHNVGALLVGYLSALAVKLPVDERRAVTMEVGIQNSALALSIVFNFFPQAGGMMLIAGFWSVWHLSSGSVLALIWSRERLNKTENEIVMEGGS